MVASNIDIYFWNSKKRTLHYKFFYHVLCDFYYLINQCFPQTALTKTNMSLGFGKSFFMEALPPSIFPSYRTMYFFFPYTCSIETHEDRYIPQFFPPLYCHLLTVLMLFVSTLKLPLILEKICFLSRIYSPSRLLSSLTSLFDKNIFLPLAIYS
jgi:hypothetical protein